MGVKGRREEEKEEVIRWEKMRIVFKNVKR